MFFSDVSSCALSCRFMICERSADPRMISRLEHKSLLARGSLCFVLCAKPAIYNDLQSRYVLWRSACQHIWIIVMCSIRDNCVSFMFALSVSIPIGSLMFHMHYSAFVKGVWLYVSACIGTMHVHARIESLHVYARIPSFSCFCMCLLISKADQVSAFVCSYWEICVYLHSLAYTESWAFVCMWLESWAFVGMFQELSVYLHSVPCVESCACVVCMCLVC